MTRWTRATLESALAGSPPSLNGADLQGLDLSGLLLGRVDLAYAQLAGADLAGADLRGAVLFAARAPGVRLRGADLRDANMTAADLTGADLGAALLTGARLSGTDLSGALLDAGTDVLAHGAVLRHPVRRELPVDPRAVQGVLRLRVGDVLRIRSGGSGERWTTGPTGPPPVLTATDPEGGVPGHAASAGPLRLAADRPGHGSLVLRPQAPDPGGGEVVVEVEVAGPGGGGPDEP